MTTTQQGLLDFLNTIDPIPQDLINQLNKNPQATITKWMARSKEDWKDFYGLNGIDIYNHINPHTVNPPIITTAHQILDMTFSPIIPTKIRSSKATTTSISKKYPMPPLTLTKWDGFYRDVADCAQSIPDVRLATPFIPTEPLKCPGEIAVQSAADYTVYRALNILMENLIPHFDFLTKGEFTSIEGRKKVFADPDRIWSSFGFPLSKLIVEFKSPWAFNGGDDIIELYNAECSNLKSGKVKKKGKVMRSIEQTYVYMTINRHRYGCFTTFDKTWFLRRVEDPSSEHSSLLQISPVILCDSNRPITLTMAWMYLLLKIERSSDWLYSSPHSSAVTSPTFMTSQNSVDYDRYRSVCLDGLMHWKDIVGRSQAGAVAVGTFRDLPDVVFKTIDISKKPGGLKQFDHEVQMYKHMESLQGICIPRLIAYGNLGGLIQVIVLENVGKHITMDQFQARKSDIDFAVQNIHDLNVKHGDLRLPNITIDSSDRIRILDFGMSSIIDQCPIIDPYQVED